MITGFLRELGRPCLFHRARRLEIPPTNSRVIHGSASGAGGDEPRTPRWYRQAKETKRGEMGGRESQHLIVPWKRGNQPEEPRQGNFEVALFRRVWAQRGGASSFLRIWAK